LLKRTQTFFKRILQFSSKEAFDRLFLKSGAIVFAGSLILKPSFRQKIR